MTPTVSVVVPAFNEEARLPDLFDALLGSASGDLAAAGLDFLEAVIVDDGSTDRTAAMLADAAARDPRLRPVVDDRPNAGKGAAIARGIAHARGELVLLVDVDLSTPIGCAVPLARALREAGAEMAIGSRDSPGSRVNAPAHRRLLGAGFNFAVRRLTGLEHPDTQCGFKLIETDVARRLTAIQVSRGFAYDVELLMRARAEGVRVVDVPVVYVHDDRSKVKVLRATGEMAWDLLRIRHHVRRERRRAAGLSSPQG